VDRYDAWRCVSVGDGSTRWDAHQAGSQFMQEAMVKLEQVAVSLH
jgi:hypothetical protein